MPSVLKQSERSELLKKPNAGEGTTATKANASFVIATSSWHEIQLILQRCSMMTLQMVCQLSNAVVALIFVGQLPNSSILLAGVGLSRTFVNVTGTAMAWGFTTALFTLLPQAVGKGETRLIRIHVQRSFYIVTVVSCFLSIIQFFAGDVLIWIGQPAELYPIVSTYCRFFIPYIFLTGYVSILMRLGQALDLNVGLTMCCLIMFVSCPIFAYFFMFACDFGYVGAAIGVCCALLIFCVALIILYIRKGYGDVFKPLPLNVVCTGRGISTYLSLAIPGLFQSAFQWIIEETAVILAGYVAQPTVALSTTVILANVFAVVIPFAIGICNSTNIRVGKYIGLGNVMYAKRAALFGMAVAIILLLGWCAILLSCRHVIPRIYTDDVETIELVSTAIYVMTIYVMGCFVMMTVGGIYRGLGFQKVSAYVTFVSFWIVAWPMTMIGLFGFDIRKDLRSGVLLIWSGLATGNVLAGAVTSIYLLCRIDWEEAVRKSDGAIQDTKKDYYATENHKYSDSTAERQADVLREERTTS